MLGSKNKMIYSSFAKLYDELMDETMYEKWFDFATHELKPNVGPVLELACGAGRLAVMLAQSGYEIVGVDQCLIRDHP